jgi:bifunctional non-homologous end joining protein LigD
VWVDLPKYRAKRDFRRTPEPPPGPTRRADSARAGVPQPRFVVHEHHARRLHWDLRLEHDGALMSWAVPNGLPQDPSENRKAVHVEDHPLSYIDFEGDIPAGSYGAGRVLIWDRGSYECEKFESGKLVILFHGERLRGRYALFRTGEERDWMIHRMDPPEDEREKMPERLRPMLATAGPLPRDGEDEEWAYEVKWDGVRAISYWRPGRMRIESRNLNDVSSRYPEIRALGRELGSREAVLDGEIVALDEQGRPSFERLQGRMHQTSESVIRRLAQERPVTYAIFDLLYLDGHSTMALPYRERRALLKELDLNGPAWQTPAYRVGGGRDFLAVTAEHGLEGVLVKRLDSRYRPGERGRDWLKVKNVNRQELVIGGWLLGRGRRTGQIGALLMGYQEGTKGDRQVLRYAGRVGTGFDESELERLGAELAQRKRRSSPFAKQGEQPPREARFVEPDLVAEIEFSHWTRQGILRHSVYKGLRTDKAAREVIRETPTAGTAGPRPSGARKSGGSVTNARTALAEIDGSASERPYHARTAPPEIDGSASERPYHARTTPPEIDGSAAERPYHARTTPPEIDGSAAERPYQVLRETKRYTEIEVQGHTLRLSNREKVLYPSTGFTKGQLIDYYAAVAPVLLAHLAGRPLTFKRYPDGVNGDYFYEKRCPAHRPGWVQTASIRSERLDAPIDYCLVEDLPTLIWIANLADLELHTSLSLATDMDTPTALVFDLDPGESAGLRECARVALWIRELFEAFERSTLVKTSGSKGLQVYLPLNTPVSYEQTKPFARAVAELLEKQHPELVLSRMTKRLRAGKVLIDWSQNDPHKTTVCVYSPRARERPMISTPLTWEQVARASRSRSEKLQLSLEPQALLERVEREGDLFAPLAGLAQTLPELAGQGSPRPAPPRRNKRSEGASSRPAKRS